MELKILNDDPLGVLTSTKLIVENLRHLTLNENRLDELAKKIIERFKKGLDDEYELGIGSTGTIEEDLQLVFIEDVVNFCFWSGKNDQKWEIEYPMGNTISGGWYGLVGCFKRGIAEGIKICDAKFLSNLTIDEARNFFRGKGNAGIPLLDERVKNLREAGTVLLEHFEGKIINLIKFSNYDSVEIIKNILKYFPSFRDISYLNGKEVKFLKRVQICPNDFSYVLKNTQNKITNLDKLTAYADYKLPQVLRMCGIFNYSIILAGKVDSMTEILHDSGEEIEIRAATIWAVELLRQKIGNLSAGEIDNTMWIISQGIQNESKPYHRTRTIFY